MNKHEHIPDSVSITVRIDADLAASLREMMIVTQRTQSAVVRDLLRRGIASWRAAQKAKERKNANNRIETK